MRHLIVLVFFLCAAVSARADEHPWVPAGERVRLHVSAGAPVASSRLTRFEAAMGRMSADSLWATPRGSTAERGFALGEVRHLDLYTGRDHPAGLRRGFLIGLGAGVVGGLALGLLLGTADDASFGDAFALTVPLGSFTGAFAGAVAGRAHWERRW